MRCKKIEKNKTERKNMFRGSITQVVAISCADQIMYYVSNLSLNV